MSALRFILLLLLATVVHAQVPALLNHQGRMAVNGINFDGTGQFKFALVNTDGSATFWSNDGTAAGEPATAVSLPVNKGLYSVLLGDTTLTNMTAVPPAVFANGDVRLRVWFNDGTLGFQQITPDQRLVAAPYALTAATVADASITTPKLAPDLTLSGTTVFNGHIQAGDSHGLSPPQFRLHVKGSTTGQPGWEGGGMFGGDHVAVVAGQLEVVGLGFTATLGAHNAAANQWADLVINPDGGQVGIGTFTPTAMLDVAGTVKAGAFVGDGSGLTGIGLTDGSIFNRHLNDAAAIADTKLATISTAGKVSNSATSASTANNPHTIVMRDFSGSFSAGTITAGAFIGDGSGLTGISSTAITDGSIFNDDVNDNAAIAYSKLNLTGSIANADISPTAAIADSKLATINTAGKVDNSATTATTAANPNTIALRDATGSITATAFIGDGSGLTGIASSSSQVLLADIKAPPTKPVIAWGNNHEAQTTVPTLANVIAVTASSTQSLAVLQSGSVIAWGTGPAVPAGLTGVTKISAGVSHVLAIKSDGSYVAWGDSTYGQTAGPAGITTAQAIAAGEKHSLLLLANGTVLAWGDITFGQTTIPAGLSTVTAIAAGYDHSLALKADGTVVAWGRNDVGQTDVPAGLTNVVFIAAGAYHSLAVKSDGTVVAWGWNTGGQSTVPASLTGVKNVSGGYSFSIALKADGTLVAWGDNSSAQTTIPASAVQISAVTAGATHVVALFNSLIPAQVARLDQDNVFTGKVGIKRTAAANTLEVEGNASKTTAGNWLANSDRRIKANIQPISGALQKLDQVRLVDFNYTADYITAHPEVADKRYLNVIAQEFAKVFPDHVQSSGETLPDGSPILQVDTYPLTIYSAAAIQELHRENEALKKKLAEQEERLRRLEEGLAK